MLFTVNNSKFSLRKTLITFRKFPVKGCDVYKSEFTSWETFNICSRSNFGLSVQNCCIEKENEENNDNCKDFSVTRKCEKHGKLCSVHCKTWKTFSINNIFLFLFILLLLLHIKLVLNFRRFFIIMTSWSYFKAEAVIERRFSKIVVLQCNFCALVKALWNACEIFHFSSFFISSPQPVILLKDELLVREYVKCMIINLDNYFVEHILVDFC